MTICAYDVIDMYDVYAIDLYFHDFFFVMLSVRGCIKDYVKDCGVTACNFKIRFYGM
jgi:hypothetical protein